MTLDRTNGPAFETMAGVHAAICVPPTSANGFTHRDGHGPLSRRPRRHVRSDVDRAKIHSATTDVEATSSVLVTTMSLSTTKAAQATAKS